MPPLQLALIPRALALAMGLVWRFTLTPSAVSRGEVIAAFDALARGAAR